MNAVGDNLSATHQLIRIKYIANILDECREAVDSNKRNQDSDILYPYYGASGIIDTIDGFTIDDHVMLIGEDGANLKTRNLPLMYEVNGKAWINNHAHILKPKENIDFMYLFYALESSDINPYITGSAQPKLNQENLKNILISVPSIMEQRIISGYLNTKCAEIESICVDILTEIKTLEDYKKSVITEAVTKGLQPDVVMMDSGVTWNMIRIKYVANILDECREAVDSNKRNQDSDILYPYYGASGIIDTIDGFTIDDHVMLIGEDGANLKTRNLPLIYEVIGKAWINNHAHILKPKENIDFMYLFYALESSDINPYITGSAQPKLNQENLKNILVPLPPILEQKAIANYLDTKCSEIDTLIQEKKEQLTTMTDYKKALIYEYVTGKKTCTPCQQNENANDMLQENKS